MLNEQPRATDVQMLPEDVVRRCCTIADKPWKAASHSGMWTGNSFVARPALATWAHSSQSSCFESLPLIQALQLWRSDAIRKKILKTTAWIANTDDAPEPIESISMHIRLLNPRRIGILTNNSKHTDSVYARKAYTCQCICIYTYICIYICIYMCAYICSYICVCISKYIGGRGFVDAEGLWR